MGVSRFMAAGSAVERDQCLRVVVDIQEGRIYDIKVMLYFMSMDMSINE
jgi:hypothetical protein